MGEEGLSASSADPPGAENIKTLVPRGRFELPHPCGYSALNAACLPVSPSGLSSYALLSPKFTPPFPMEHPLGFYVSFFNISETVGGKVDELAGNIAHVSINGIGIDRIVEKNSRNFLV